MSDLKGAACSYSRNPAADDGLRRDALVFPSWNDVHSVEFGKMDR